MAHARTAQPIRDGPDCATPDSDNASCGLSGTDLTIGGLPSGNLRFDGSIDDVRVDGRTLTANEVQVLAELGAAGTCPGTLIAVDVYRRQ